jgi:hypothetical protein
VDQQVTPADLMRRALAAPIVAGLWIVLRAMQAWDDVLADPGDAAWDEYDRG